MPRARTTETADRIRSAALELIARKGVHQVSLREIAERVGITKPALYYHFASREELVRSLVQPLIDDVEATLAPFGADADPRELLGAYFDVTYRHRDITTMIMREPSILALVDLAAAVGDWRRRMVTMLAGPDPSLPEVVRAQMAIGGLGDCTVVLPGADPAGLREAVLDAACDTLLIGAGGRPARTDPRVPPPGR
ncbi:helix-turn-helix domain-containing protein [Actinoplanes sp. NEAU-A12]|uniref:Helix-turn-helix domain-containing protein n=1 Tax=Actinoplanes sandaracinus TaxID=3045177 RepID=A0ABT6WYS6_9ACTN|nr:TetR/AcrR family transcriptional regulator [Actinoplanes sandaracinus]MDI6104887.1 helix-turn-helix domain-containing protein [Actinoplanes sandaracinus]